MGTGVLEKVTQSLPTSLQVATCNETTVLPQLARIATYYRETRLPPIALFDRGL